METTNSIRLTSSAVNDPGWPSFVFFCLLPVAIAVGGLWLWRRRSQWLAKSPAWLTLVIFNGLALAAFLTFGFLVGECYYRFIYDTTDSYNYTFASRRWFDRYYHFNSAQLRDNVEYPEEIPAGSRRVTFLGDSFTVAQGVKNVDDRFANRLRKLHPEWDVQVLAVDGVDTGQQLEGMDRLVRHNYKMDVVVLAYCLNDVGDIMDNWRAETIFRDWNTRSWLVQHSYFANTYYFRLKARLDPNIPNYFSTVGAAYKSKTWEVQKLRLASLRSMVESHGGHFVVVTFPFINALGPGYEFQGIHDQLNEFWRTMKTPHLDLLPACQNYPASKMVVNRLDAHPNELAHRVMAEAMDKFLKEQMLVVPAPGTAGRPKPKP